MLDDKADSKQNNQKLSRIKDLQKRIEVYDEASEDQKPELFDEIFEEFEELDDSWDVDD